MVIAGPDDVTGKLREAVTPQVCVVRFRANVGRCLVPKLYRDCPHLPVNAVFLPGGGELRDSPPLQETERNLDRWARNPSASWLAR